jgi:hypothetical protein
MCANLGVLSLELLPQHRNPYNAGIRSSLSAAQVSEGYTKIRF